MQPGQLIHRSVLDYMTRNMGPVDQTRARGNQDEEGNSESEDSPEERSNSDSESRQYDRRSESENSQDNRNSSEDSQPLIRSLRSRAKRWVGFLRFARSATTARSTYVPSAQLNLGKDVTWDSIRDYPGQYSALLVEDLYSSATGVLEHLVKLLTPRDPDGRSLTRREIDPFIALTSSGVSPLISGGFWPFTS